MREQSKKIKRNISKKIIMPKKISYIQIKKFFEKKGLKELVDLSEQRDLKVNEMIIGSPHKPELIDLYRLYQFVFLNKRTTILEFGSGYSSLIFSLALHNLNILYKNKISKLRRNNPFELFILENEKKFLNITKKRINNFNKKFKLKNKINSIYQKEISKFQYNIPYKSGSCSPLISIFGQKLEGGYMNLCK